MERIQKEEKITVVVNDAVIEWKKIGGGSLRIGNRIIKPGEKFKARVDEIPKAFLDTIVPTKGVIEPDVPLEVVEKKPMFKLELKGESKTLYNVVRIEDSKVINEKGLKKEVAEQFIADLEK